jgi:formylglycine-generating enzyme required for sulfatase activity
MVQVFISHCTPDRAFVETEILPVLQAHGIKSWYARDDILGAEEWEESIKSGLESCEWFLVVMSPRAAASRWVRAEVRWAFRNRSGKILPVLHEPCDPEDFHLMMPDVQHIDFAADARAARARLGEVCARISPPAGPSQTPDAARSGEVVNSVGMRLLRVPAGRFPMGSPADEPDAGPYERPRHEVTISRPFLLGVRPVTQGEYRQDGTNPSRFRDDDRLPVESVSWLDAVEYCNTLSTSERLPRFYRVRGQGVEVPDWDAPGYRLPTEAEWEYACRAGTASRYSHGDDERGLDEHAWYDMNAGGRTHPVGSKQANPWGFHDMHGNVWEWCWDIYAKDFYRRSPLVDPRGPDSGTWRVLRGGSWLSTGDSCRSAFRSGTAPGDGDIYIGFRAARRAPEP